MQNIEHGSLKRQGARQFKALTELKVVSMFNVILDIGLNNKRERFAVIYDSLTWEDINRCRTHNRTKVYGKGILCSVELLSHQ